MSLAQQSPTSSRSSPPSPVETGDASLPASGAPEPSITSEPTRCTHSRVVIELSTVLVISNYPAHYQQIPIHSFEPKYQNYEDGSLLAAPFRADMLDSSATLLMLGCLATIFLRNIFVSGDYIRRGKVKKKALFYLLLASQLLAPVSLIPVIASHFIHRFDCRVISSVSYLAAMISMGILITGILGIKAYKCLENPKLVPVILVLLQASVSGVVIVDLIQTPSFRRLSGSCVQLINMKYTRLFVGLQMIQALFVCLCFVYASYKSHSNPVARGRISLRLSMEDIDLDTSCCEDEGRQAPQGRGWWDYVPGSGETNAKGQRRSGFLHRLFSWLRHVASGGRNCPCPRGNGGYPQDEPKASAPVEVTGSEEDHRGRDSPALSTNSGFSRLFPRMELFRQVVSDELLYTTFITATCVVVAILVAISVNFKTCLSLTVWVTINWAFISLLLVHSLGRVVHRREREAWIHQSVIRSGITRHPRGNSRPASRRTHGTARSYSFASTKNKSIRERYRGDPNDPYSETRPLDQEKFDWQFGNMEPMPFPSALGANGRSPLMLSVRNVAQDSRQEPEFEFEPARRRKVSWQSNIFSTNGRHDSISIYSVDMSSGKPIPTRI